MKKNSQYESSIDKIIENIESDEYDVESEETADEAINDSIDINLNERKLYLDKVDKSTSDLFRMIRESEICLQPSFQRKFIWNKKIMSKFIESLLLGIPIPTIFLSENIDNTFDVIDGQQRLTTIFLFMKSGYRLESENETSIEIEKSDDMRLEGLEALKKLNGKKYSDLEVELKRKFNNVSLPVVIVQRDSTEDIKYDIFSRINQGSIKLNEQELYNVMYRGVLIDSLNKVAETKEVKEIFGYRPVLEKRFGFQQILLRSVAMNRLINKTTWNLQEVSYGGNKTVSYGGRLNTVIIQYLSFYRDNKAEAQRLYDELVSNVRKVRIVFGEDAFFRSDVVSEKYSTSINKTVAETQLNVLSKYSEQELDTCNEKIKESFIEFTKANDIQLFTKATNNTKNVEVRYSWGRIVDEVISRNG